MDRVGGIGAAGSGASSDSLIVVGEGGFRGHTTRADLDAAAQSGYVRIELEGHERAIAVPISTLRQQADGSYYVPLSDQDFEASEFMGGEDVVLVVPVIEEDVAVSRRRMVTGRVRLTKRVTEHEEVIDETGFQERVEVEHVPVNRLLDEPAKVRFEDDTMIIPVMEEVAVVEKRLMLKEEIRVTKIREPLVEPQRIMLRKEEVDIERLAPEDIAPAEGEITP